MPETTTDKSSPQWSATTKLVIGLTFVAIVGALLIRFNVIIGPLILTFMLSYLLHPLVSWVSSATRLSWRGSVNLIYLVFILTIIGFLTASGVAVVQQLQNLVRIVSEFVSDLPHLLENLSTQTYQYSLGPWQWELSFAEVASQFNIDLLGVGEQILSVLQPVVGQAGGLIGTIATSAIGTIGWGLFILVISYFVLADAGRMPQVIDIDELPGYSEDLSRLGRELGRVWNAFLRGQLLLFVMVVVASLLLMTILGVRNALGIAFLAGLAKFVPYLGSFVTGVVTALVAFFQNSNYLGIEPLTYAIVVVAVIIVLDQVFDNLVTPRIYGNVLGVHPAAVLVAAFVAYGLIGLVGLLLAAPVLASLQLFGRYTIRKMLDLPPWPEPEAEGTVEVKWPLEDQARRLWQWMGNLLKRGK